MKKILITGASGMVGGETLKLALKSSDVSQVTALVRKPLPIQHDKLEQIIHQDLSCFEGLESVLAQQDVCLYCVGVYTGAVNDEVFHQVTVTMPVNLAKALKAVNPAIEFHLLSGQGADRTEKSRMLFAREKGQAENKLNALLGEQFYCYRPGYIYPVEPRNEPNFTYRLSRIIYKPLRKLYPNIGVRSTKLAGTMLANALVPGTLHILENRDIRQFQYSN